MNIISEPSNLNLLYKKLTKTTMFSIKMVICLLIISISMLGVIFYQHYTLPEETYFARSVTGNTIEMLALKSFNVSPNSLINWSMVAATNAYTIDFYNYEKSLEKISTFFTKEGFVKFKKSLELSDRLKEIIDKKLITSAVAADSPIILREGSKDSNYFWEVQLPITITYQGAMENIKSQWIIVNLLIKKVPNSELKQGIGIDNIVSRDIPPMY